MPRPYLAVLFDLDGTLTTVDSVWKHIHEALGIWGRDAEADQRRFLDGSIDYETFCRLDAGRWKGQRVRKLRQITDRVELRPGVRELRRHLRNLGLRIGVISTGLTLLAERIHYDLGLDFTIANRLVTRGGCVTGEVKVNVEHGRKDEAVSLFCHQFGVPPGQVISVGDSEGDISMFRAVGFSVAFNPAGEPVASAASAVCMGENLMDLLLHLPLDAPGKEEEGIH